MITPDPTTPEGEAIIKLHEQMAELRERTDEWPGADTVDILDKWLALFDFTSPVKRTRLVAGSVWVLRREDRHEDDVTIWSDEDSALAALAEHVRSSWDNVQGNDGIPDLPPLEDRLAVDLYYGPRSERSDEDYWLYGTDVGRCVRTAPASHDFRFPDEKVSAQINSAALFHAPAGPDGEGLPCIEIAGVLVFAYLDAGMQAVRVSVHLDTADELVIQPGQTVPLHVQVEDSTVFSAGAVLTRPTGGGRRQWLRGLSHRMPWRRGD
ncbi:hypothetical protein ADL25_44655 [Streptomyces sp. NRRL F-5122]|uniref:hypothetical protein n=1 Tax=Streptomyces sp. NRRL F-5122 TaxID=1609098 RepID=UPI000740D6EA|nr:hypothetical protein [Streptomyces sp. NRRL F-5122]KUJ33571.1 hypothetical protein ADL25_44655 [Streptomyces sp. NRRL F-5122]